MKTCKKSVSFHSLNIMYKSDFKHNTIIVQLKIFILVLSWGQIDTNDDMNMKNTHQDTLLDNVVLLQ